MPCIYCVEDDENIRELVAYALESQQFETQTFADGESFYKVLEKKIPDLVLLDIMLPGESGIEILKKIRHKERTADLPVIMLTARTSEYDVVKGLCHQTFWHLGIDFKDQGRFTPFPPSGETF